MNIDLLILFVMSVITFSLFATDKQLAVRDKGRIPEVLLFILIAFDGAFGALCGMMFFNHKTRHRSFTITVPLALMLQMAVHILLRMFILR